MTAGLYPGLLAYGCAVLMDFGLRLPSLLHPVAWFGRAAGLLIARAPRQPRSCAFGLGLSLALGLPLAAAGGAHFALRWAERSAPAFGVALQAVLLYCCVCLFGLLDAARALRSALREQGVCAARKRLSWLCSRDARALDAQGLANGAIESLAENLSDSVVAPLCFLVAFGLEGAIAYRALNTLDAMIGYRGRYEWLGKASARLDDLANWAPARLTALLLLMAGGTLGARRGVSCARGLRTWARDRARTPSPNGGQPMAMAAGLLGVRLDKPGHYVLGAALTAPEPHDIDRALSLCVRAGVLALLLAGACLAFRGGRLV